MISSTFPRKGDTRLDSNNIVVGKSSTILELLSDEDGAMVEERHSILINGYFS